MGFFRVVLLAALCLPTASTAGNVPANPDLEPMDSVPPTMASAPPTAVLRPGEIAPLGSEIGANDFRISDMGPDGSNHYLADRPAIAYNSLAEEYLVVWDGTDNVGGLAEGEREIFGQRLSSEGVAVGVNDVRLTFVGGTGDPSYDALSPDIAFNGNFGEYLVVWQGNDPSLQPDDSEIWGQVLDSEARPAHGSGHFRISFMGPDTSSAYQGYSAAVAYNDLLDEYLVVWSGSTNSGGLVAGEYEIWAQRVSSIGTLIGTNFRISDMGGTGDPDFDALTPEVAFNRVENEYLIVWDGDDDTGALVEGEFEIYGQLIDSGGAGVGPNDFRLTDMGGIGDPDYDTDSPDVAYNETANEYLVVWYGDDNVGGLVNDEYEVFSQRLDADLGGLGPNDYRLSDVGGIGNINFWVSQGPRVAYNALDDEYLVVWTGGDDVDGMVFGEYEVFAQRLTSTIQGIGPNDQRISDACGLGESTCFVRASAIAGHTANGQFLVAWAAQEDLGSGINEYEIWGQRVVGSWIFGDSFESGDTSNWITAP